MGKYGWYHFKRYHNTYLPIESAIRLAVSLGGDADTMGAITGGIAEAFYGGVPEHIRKEVLKQLPNEFIEVMKKFYQKIVKE